MLMKADLNLSMFFFTRILREDNKTQEEVKHI